MTSLADILASLAARGVILRAEGDRLKLNAPRGALSEDDLAAVRQHKAAILDALTSGRLCLDCGHDRDYQGRGVWFCAWCRTWHAASDVTVSEMTN